MPCDSTRCTAVRRTPIPEEHLLNHVRKALWPALAIALAAVGLAPAPSRASWMVPTTPYTAKDFTMVKRNGVYHLFYILNNPNLPFSDTQKELGHATSGDLYFWTQQPTVLPVRPGFFDAAHVWAPSIVERDGVYYMFYTGVADSASVHHLDQRTGVATSTDLMTWNRFDQPVFDCGQVPWSWCDSLAAVPFRDPFVVADPEQPGAWWMTYAAAPASEPTGMIAGLARSEGDVMQWQDAGSIPATFRDQTFSDLMESPHCFEHDGVWYLFFTTNSGQPLSYATTPAPLTTSSTWTLVGRLSTMLGYSTANWYASEYFRDGLVEYFSYVNGDRVEINKLTWTGPGTFQLVQPDLFHVQRMTWAKDSVKTAGTVTLTIESKWGAGHTVPIEAFWLDSLDVWHSIPNIDLGLPNQFSLTGDLSFYTWTAGTFPPTPGAPPVPRIVIRLADQTAASNTIWLVPPNPSGEPDPNPWPGPGNPGGFGTEGYESNDLPILRTLKRGMTAAMPAVLVDLKAETDARIDVFDLQGRKVRNLADRRLPKGATVYTWDGRDLAGRRVGAGLYFVRLQTPAGIATTRVLLR